MYCLLGSTVIDYLILSLSLLTFLALFTSSTTTPLIDLNIVENNLKDATLLDQTTETTIKIKYYRGFYLWQVYRYHACQGNITPTRCYALLEACRAAHLLSNFIIVAVSVVFSLGSL